MKILVNEDTKELNLIKNDGTVVSTYSYKNVIKDDFTIDELKADIDGFNITLSRQPEFDNIKDLAPVLKIHNW